MIAINFLPWRELILHSKRRRNIFIYGGIVFVVFILFGLYLNHNVTLKKVTNKQVKNLPIKNVAKLPNKKLSNEKWLLASYAIDSIKLSGIIIKQQQAWALLAVPDGTLTKIKIGDIICKRQLKVVLISANSVVLHLIGTAKANKAKQQRFVLHIPIPLQIIGSYDE